MSDTFVMQSGQDEEKGVETVHQNGKDCLSTSQSGSSEAGLSPGAKEEDEEKVEVDVYPGDRGDWRAMSCAVGVFFTLFIGFGILNVPGTFQTYWQDNQLAGYSQSEIGWIVATQFFLTLFGSVLTGRYFDLYGGRVCVSFPRENGVGVNW